MEAKKSGDKGFYKWEVLALLWFAFFINQADRQIYNTLLNPISESLGLTTSEAGLIATLFGVVFAVLGPIAGVLSDRYSKKRVIVFAVLLWSVATVVSGSCVGLVSFIIFRSVATGMGEAFFAPANYATIADYHDNRTRARAMSIHQTSYYFGVIASGALAGWVADKWGWRNAFYIFGSVGVIFGFYLVWRLRDKVSEEELRVPENGRLTGAADVSTVSDGTSAAAKTQPQAPSFFESLAMIFRVRTALCLVAAFSSLIFVLQGYLTWSTWYLSEKFGLSHAQAGFSAMFYTHAAAFLGVLVAGCVSDKLAVKNAGYRILLQAAGLLAASPFIVMMGLSGNMVAVYAGFAGFGFFRAFFDANTYTVLYDVIPKRFQASAAGVMLSIGFGIGSLSPWLLGYVDPIMGLSRSIASLSAVWIVFAAVLFAAFKLFYEADHSAARNFDLTNK